MSTNTVQQLEGVEIVNSLKIHKKRGISKEIKNEIIVKQSGGFLVQILFKMGYA